MSKKRKLGELLCAKSSISEQDLAATLAEQGHSNLLLGELLLQRGLVAKSALVEALQEITHVPYVDCGAVVPDAVALRSMPQATALNYCSLPLKIAGRRLVTVMVEPQNLLALDELRFVSGLDIEPRLGFREEIMAAIQRCYAIPAADLARFGASPVWLKDADLDTVHFASASSSQRNQAAILEAQAELRGRCTPAVQLLSWLLKSASQKKASDIHVEQLPDGALVRIRVDGVLTELTRVPDQIRTQLVSRIKILADMDIAERRAPQDGRLLATIDGHDLDLRVSTLPTQYGEKVVVRLLDSTVVNVNFESLGLSRSNAKLLASVISEPQGLVLVTGPTGSGKTTTLYSALNLLRSPRINLVTIEDPVEYVLSGINQVQVNPKAGRTFASCLRAMLRQDPNVIMVGEIRDGETAEIALTAAQTGHMVLSTLHTNDSIATVTRLLDLGVQPFLVSSSVSAILAQRLIRKLCACHDTVPATEEYLEGLAALGVEAGRNEMCIPVGCSQCDGIGYKGRLGVFELLVMNHALRAAIRNGARTDEMCALAHSAGMKLLHEDAVVKVLERVTTLDEVLRVVSIADGTASSCGSCGQVLAASFKFCPQCGTRVSSATGMRYHPFHRVRKSLKA